MSTVLITGGHSGIGYEASKTLASAGTHLVLAGRSPDRMQAVADELGRSHGVTVTVLALDTSSLASVRTAAGELRHLVESGAVARLDAVLSNAGGRFDGAVSHSHDGYETTFATNCLGPFLLVELLVPLMAERGRVVYTASGTHDRDSMDGRLVGPTVEPDAMRLANVGRDGGKPLSAGKRYSTSKLCTVMYAYELDRRLRRGGSSIASIAFDPGSIPDTAFLRGMSPVVRRIAVSNLMKRVQKRAGVVTSTAAFSGASLAALALEPTYADASGTYFQANDGQFSAVGSATMSYDLERARTLWNSSKELVRLRDDEEPVELR